MARLLTLAQQTRQALDATAALALRGGPRVAPFLFRVPGYLYPHEAVFLYWLAREGPGEGDIVELGSFHGRSTLCLAAGLRDRGPRASGRLAAVDPHPYGTEGLLRRNLGSHRLDDQVDVVRLPSCEAAATWRRPVRLLFIDGDHAEPAVRADLAAWLGHVVPGGVVALHDSTEVSGYPGPRALAGEMLLDAETWDATGTLGSVTWASRRPGGRWVPRTYGTWMDTMLRRIRRSRPAA